MPSPSKAQMTSAIGFPEDPGDPFWEERRRFPVVTLLGAPAAFLMIAAVTVRPLALHVIIGAAAVIAVSLILRARRRALIETYAVSERFVTIEQPGGARAAVDIQRLTGVTIAGDRVRLDSLDGTLTLGFVRSQRRLERALAQVAPRVRVERDLTAFRPT
jgi:hypothetical protein